VSRGGADEAALPAALCEDEALLWLDSALAGFRAVGFGCWIRCSGWIPRSGWIRCSGRIRCSARGRSARPTPPKPTQPGRTGRRPAARIRSRGRAPAARRARRAARISRRRSPPPRRPRARGRRSARSCARGGLFFCSVFPGGPVFPPGSLLLWQSPSRRTARGTRQSWENRRSFACGLIWLTIISVILSHFSRRVNPLSENSGITHNSLRRKGSTLSRIPVLRGRVRIPFRG
jgi:hypothetical protein